MSLITRQPKPPARQPVSLKLEADVFASLKAYATFLESSQEYVITQLLRLAFQKDKEFQQWLTEHGPSASAAEAPGPARRPARALREARPRAHTPAAETA